MCFLIFIAVLKLPVALCQDIHPVKQLYQPSIIVNNYLKPNGTTGRTAGCGFFINNSYFVTCYHLYLPHDNIRNQKLYAIYNIKSYNGKTVFDTVGLTLNYKTNRYQYNFKRHIFKRDDFSTDIVVFKTIRKVNVSSVALFKQQHSQFEKVVAIGMLNNNNLDVKKASLLILGDHKDYPNENCTFIVFIGLANEGFSGTPIFNDDSKVIGIIQSGIQVQDSRDLEEQLKQLDFFNPHTKKTSLLFRKNVASSYKRGDALGYGIDINSVMDNYLKGYIQ